MGIGQILSIGRAEAADTSVTSIALIADTLLTIPVFIGRASYTNSVNSVVATLAATLLSVPFFIFRAGRSVLDTLAVLDSESRSTDEAVSTTDDTSLLLTLERSQAARLAARANAVKRTDVVESSPLKSQLVAVNGLESDELVCDGGVLSGVEALEGEGGANSPPVVGNMESIEGRSDVGADSEGENTSLCVDGGADELEAEGEGAGGAQSSELGDRSDLVVGGLPSGDAVVEGQLVGPIELRDQGLSDEVAQHEIRARGDQVADGHFSPGVVRGDQEQYASSVRVSSAGADRVVESVVEGVAGQVISDGCVIAKIPAVTWKPELGTSGFSV